MLLNLWCYADATLMLGWGGVGWGMLAFMWSWTRCGCYVEHAVHVTLPVWGGGWGGVGHVSIHVKLNTLVTALGLLAMGQKLTKGSLRMFLVKSQHYAHVHKPWRIFGTLTKSENYLKQRYFRICGFLRLFVSFCGIFVGFCGFSPWSFEALQIFCVLCLTKSKNMQSKS